MSWVAAHATQLATFSGGLGLVMFGLLLRELRVAPTNRLHPDYELTSGQKEH